MTKKLAIKEAWINGEKIISAPQVEDFQSVNKEEIRGGTGNIYRHKMWGYDVIDDIQTNKNKG